jgi:AraC family transcriptional activator of mtrCDE
VNTAKLTALIGYLPIEYLTAWRLQIAAHWLMVPHMSAERIAWHYGYESVSAFSIPYSQCL